MGGARRLAVLLVLAALLIPPGAAAAASATFTVDTFGDSVDAAPGDGTCADAGGHCSLRAAVMEANANAGADTILVPPGTYTLTIPGRDENAAATGDLDITDAVTIRSTVDNPALTIVQAGTDATNGIDKVFSINPSLTLAFATTLQGLTIRYGYNTSSRATDGYGGGLDWEASGTGTLTITNCIITENTVTEGDGGGLLASNQPGTAAARITITNSQVTNNRAPSGIGGGIMIGTTTPFTLTNSVVSGNTTHNSSTSTGSGAGIFIFGPDAAGARSSITGSTIANNTGVGPAADGGGIYSTAPLMIRDTTISGNTTGHDGGGIWMNFSPGPDPEMSNVTISGNTAGGKGGGYLQSGYPTGAPVHNVWKNVTVTNNRAGVDGGGISRQDGIASLALHNTIVAGNLRGGAANDVVGTLDAASSFNLIGTGGAGGLTNGANGNQVGVGDPRLGPLASNGGLTQTHALLPGSPALDAGSNAVAAGASDQRGQPRIADAADADTTATVDIGAFEAHPAVEDLGDRTGNVGSAISVTFHVGDAALGIASITATSGDAAVVPNDAAHLSVGAGPSGSTRTLSITPAAAGATVITVTATAGAGSMSDTFTLTATAPPVADLTVSKSHTGDFRQGQTGAAYTISVHNSGPAATAGAVTVTDTLPAGLTATGMSGSGWTCDSGTLACTRSDALASGASYPEITLTVDVAADAPAALTNTVAVSGGGESNTGNNTATDPTTVIQLPDLTIAKSHTGTFTRGGSGTYRLDVANAGPSAASGTVTVTDALPAGLTATAMSGTGWTCDLPTLTCTRADGLAAGAAYPAITLTVAVAGGAPDSLTNTATVAHASDPNPGNNVAADPTTVVSPPPPPEPDPYVTINAPLPETREASITLTGRANPFYTVRIGAAAVQADAAGNWSLTVSLAEGPNVITATNSWASATVTVVRDSTPPPLTFTASATRTEEATVVLTASSEAGAAVSIEGQAVTSLTVPLVLGNNTFTATATDRVGNVTTATVTVERVAPPPPETPPTLDALAPEVDHADLTVAGTAMPGAVLTLLVDGAPQGTSAADDAGRFAFTATLAEGLNRISVRTASGLSSAEATVIYRKPIHFTDVDGHWAEPAIYRMARAGVVQGFPDGTFRPEAEVTRLEYTVMIVRMLNLAPSDEPFTFTDGDQIPDWARPQVAAAVRAGIVTGYDDGSFRPDRPVTRAEAAAMVVRVLQYLGAVTSQHHITFTDEDQIPAWARECVNTAAAYHLIIGYEDGTFRANNTATRAEAVAMLDRLMALLPVL